MKKTLRISFIGTNRFIDFPNTNSKEVLFLIRKFQEIYKPDEVEFKFFPTLSQIGI